ncbi:MAG: NAD(P)H-binding protein [Henriciella sp.]|jgi:putative NADH-flavin reductase
MRILLLGAEGRTGREVLRLLLRKGETVTAIVREPNQLTDFEHRNLTINIADPTHEPSLVPIVYGHDAVISALEPRLPKSKQGLEYSESGNAIVRAMKRTGVRRLIVTSTALLFPDQGFFSRLLARFARPMVRDAEKMETSIRTIGIDWTIVRLGHLTNGFDLNYRFVKDRPIEGSNAITRSGAANFIVNAIEQPEYKNTYIGLGR